MRSPLALMLCLLLGGLAMPVASADVLPPPDDVRQETPSAGSIESDLPGAAPTDTDRPARPSWSLGVVLIAVLAVVFLMRLRAAHTLPVEPLDGTEPDK